MMSRLSGVIDFSVPIKTSGVSIVLRDPRAANPDSDAVTSGRTNAAVDVDNDGMLFVVRPLSLSVWLMLVVVYVVVCIVVHLSERLSPPPPPTPSATVISSQLSPTTTTTRPTFWSSALLVLSTMTLIRAAVVDSPGSSASSSVARPRTAAARLVIIAVGVFSVVLLVAYAVNMAALRLYAVERRPSPTWLSDIDDTAVTQHSLQELVKRPDVQFVTAPASGDVTRLLLDGSGDATSASLRRRVEESMDSSPPHPLSSKWTNGPGAGQESTAADRTVQEALRLVDGSGRAFVGDSVASTYAVAQDCHLIEYRLLPETRFYAVGLSRRSRFRDQINGALLRLRELGFFHRLQTK